MRHPDDVPGLISLPAGTFLAKQAAAVPAGRLILEIGAFRGRSTCFLAWGSKRGNGARILSVDPWDLVGNIEGKGGRFRAPTNEADQDRALRALGLRDLVTSVKDFSQRVPLPTTPIGLLWIDGDHAAGAVSSDAKRFAPLVAPGGLVVFDDVGTWHPGVDRVVDGFRRNLREWKQVVAPNPLAAFRRL